MSTFNFDIIDLKWQVFESVHPSLFCDFSLSSSINCSKSLFIFFPDLLLIAHVCVTSNKTTIRIQNLLRLYQVWTQPWFESIFHMCSVFSQTGHGIVSIPSLDLFLFQDLCKLIMNTSTCYNIIQNPAFIFLITSILSSFVYISQ